MKEEGMQVRTQKRTYHIVLMVDTEKSTFEKEVVIQCDEECKRANLKTSGEQLKVLDEREREEELRNKREAELFERQMEGGKKRRRNRRKESVGETASFLQRNRFYLIIGVAAALLSVIFFAFVPHEI